MTAELLDGREIAKDYRAGLQEQVEALKEKGITPNLTVVIVGNDGASLSYVKSKNKAAEKIGMSSGIIHLEEDATEEEVLDTVRRLNEDDNVHGILVQVPLPKQVDENKVLEAIAPEKDVDGFSPVNIGRMYTEQETFIPCTPLGIMELLKHTGSLEGKEVAVIGRSHIVGQPVSKLLTNENATVTLMHSRTKNMVEKLKDYDVVVSAVGKPGLVHGKDLKEGAIVIDVGNTVVDGKLVGDVDFESAKEVASYITPVPGGVGPLTITMVLNNALIAAKRLNNVE
ncbi:MULTISPECIES: bifunctional methylenetetrahydrofolate dehydrogenase/methenyltetrahydrofolate cyclohydrolase FolD [Nosocomiicoccus]|uniref:Bifunctional protein FolD n=1 Tax=Nosocomiicoccus massiliensis TaxID=1232430 RepID=A0AAF0YMY2_9STAP|nr:MULTISPECIES: bifunctional methylenetetrahydrofolate dehydrogenase/methenyltetrahydrofolate cyclohydrolase FolD [Nosocomiicoccus]OFL49323.1 bifunctional 5,10-methylene-tetrahydrofolate dehydrogenase/5,10-methylene-tetrahydrofolate cyclohydrolase [Nosocomiicoccus sp. HMSC067E10]OFO52648.1 bifunctional 5,10-methylene-tetrahydrofolate dehydrogenase/5,10-methylene-tetrahydrofolate cyclohydrolase [Nosocomiicoccus sp. HMSC059G07]OFS62478.1 bifunctional methylenetetrahydrofolate dehydrogenase/methen